MSTLPPEGSPLQMIHEAFFDQRGGLSTSLQPPHDLYIDHALPIYGRGGPVKRIYCSGQPFNIMLCNRPRRAECSGSAAAGTGLTLHRRSSNTVLKGRPFVHHAKWPFAGGIIQFQPDTVTEVSFDMPKSRRYARVLFTDTGNGCNPAGSQS